jgi:hypothetical protein
MKLETLLLHLWTEEQLQKYLSVNGLGPIDPKYVIVGNVVGGLAVSLAAYSARAAFECQLFVQRNQGWGLS